MHKYVNKNTQKIKKRFTNRIFDKIRKFVMHAVKRKEPLKLQFASLV